jgi:hypothetical protein
VLQRLRKEGFFLKPKKCTFATNEMKYLGFVIKQNGLATDPSKVSAITTYPAPKNITELRAFLGLAAYYRQFVKGFSVTARPLYNLLRKDKPYDWQPDQQKAFDQLKRSLTSAPILKRPEWNKRFILNTDASSHGLGAVLAQLDDEKRERVICYASRTTNKAESNYGATKLECLAVVWAVDHFKHYLTGRQFDVITDHSALTYLFRQPNPTGLYARWIMRLQEYQMTIKHRPGRVNQNADALSRKEPKGTAPPKKAARQQ